MRETDTALVVAEGDDGLRNHLAAELRADGYRVAQAATLNHLNTRLAIGASALVVGDVASPAEVLKLVMDIRAGRLQITVDSTLPIVTLGPKGDELSELRALRAGADDHLAKPVGYARLLERLRALERRARWQRTERQIRIGRLELRPSERTVRLDGNVVGLTNREFELLSRLAAEPTRVFTKHELLRDVWGFRGPGHTRTVDSHACRLRQALAEAGGVYVSNVWGVGYRLLPPAAHVADNGGSGMKRGRPIKRRAPLAPGAAPLRRTPIERGRSLRQTRSKGVAGCPARRPLSASSAQRAKVARQACLVCGSRARIDPAHLIPRSLGGCDEPDCVVPLCRRCHRAYDGGELDLLGHLEPGWRQELAHAVEHVGLLGALRRLTGQRHHELN